MIKNDLGELEVFGENLYAIHSIRYDDLGHHFFVFAIRELDRWLSWEEVKFYAELLEFPTVPEIIKIQPTERDLFEEQVLEIVKQGSTFLSTDVQTGQACRMEGVVTRDVEAFAVADFRQHVFKYVRKDHVKTDEHWTRRWQRAPLKWEKPCGD